jgi:hypothetical protein
MYNICVYIFIHIYRERGVERETRDSSVGIATAYGLDGLVGVQVPIESRIFSSSQRPHRLWGPPSLLFNGYRGPFPGGKAAEA